MRVESFKGVSVAAQPTEQDIQNHDHSEPPGELHFERTHENKKQEQEVQCDPNAWLSPYGLLRRALKATAPLRRSRHKSTRPRHQQVSTVRQERRSDAHGHTM